MFDVRANANTTLKDPGFLFNNTFILFYYSFPKRFQQTIDTSSIKNRGVVSYSFVIYLFTNYLTASSNLFVERHFLSRFLDCISLEEISREIVVDLSVGDIAFRFLHRVHLSSTLLTLVWSF